MKSSPLLLIYVVKRQKELGEAQEPKAYKTTISKPPVQVNGVTDAIKYLLSQPVLNRKLL